MPAPFAASNSIDLESLLNRAISAVYKGNAKKVQQQLGTAFSANIAEAVTKGYAKKPFSVAWNSPDDEMIKHMQSNVYEFSFAKSYQQLKAATAALFDKEGKIIPFSQFKEIATRINNEMAVTHLKTEYDTAIGSGQMASRWVQYKKEQEQFPMLTYQTVGDARVRPTHAALDNVTRPIGDAFWQSYYPPNGWNCRCDVIQSVQQTATDPAKIETPEDVPTMFRTNLAENGLVFPKNHPYYTDLPKDVMQAARNNNPFAYELEHEGKNGGYVYQSKLHRTSNELSIAKLLADNGDKVILLPEISADNAVQKKLRAACLPAGLKEGKSVDAMVNGSLVEFKNNRKGSATSIDQAIREANSKGNNITICIRMEKRIAAKLLNQTIADRLQRAENIKEVWLIDSKDKVKKYKRDKFLKKK